MTLEYMGRYSKDMEGWAELHVGPPMTRLSMLRPAALARFLRQLRPDIVHTHSGVWYKTARAARMAQVKAVVHTEHGRAEGPWEGFLSRRAARHTDVVIAVSAPLQAFLAQRLRMPAGQVRLIPNGVDVTHYRLRRPSTRLRDELGVAADQPIVGSIGRLEPVKGYDVVIRAFARVRWPQETAAPVLVIAGDGSVRGQLQQLASQLGVADRVFLLGWRDDPEELYAHFSCFVMGSWSEGTSISLLEAMASGLAPLVTAVGGNPAVLGEVLAEQAVPAGDVASMAAGIERLLSPERSRALGSAARGRAEGQFGLDVMVRRYEELYHSLVNG
jgi:glycosyltransferase involved in cell wall biosynthesis